MSKLNPTTVKERALGSLLGVAIGDALGLPAECKSPGVIRETFGYIDNYVANNHSKWKDISRRAAGTISDDTQLTLALMDALRNGYDLNRIKKAHIEAWDGKWGKPLGWGGTTRTAMENIKQGKKITYVEEGAGNGPCMKITPLPIYSVYQTMRTNHGKFTNSFNASLFKKCFEISRITHGDVRCAVAAYCQSRMTIRALQDEIPEFTRQIAALFLEDARYAESRLDKMDDLLSHRMEEFLQKEQFEKETSVTSVDICTEQSSFVMNSYPMVAYCVSKYLPYRSFTYAVNQTVNAGADADSNGAMVGAISGAHLGLPAIPIELIRGLRQAKTILQQIKLFEQSI